MPEQLSSSFASPDAKKVETIFHKVAPRYDLVNDVLSLGIHRIWKKHLVDIPKVFDSVQILDCATGTGDLIFLWQERLKKKGLQNFKVVGCDPNSSMLDLARKKGGGTEIDFIQCPAESLPFEDHSFDIVSISFGLRNVSEPSTGLSEFGRVLKPGGKLLILEFGQPKNPFFSGPYSLYSRYVLPRLGGALSKSPEAYKYLESTSARFPCGQNLLDYVHQSTGPLWKNSSFESLGWGICYLYQFEKS